MLRRPGGTSIGIAVPRAPVNRFASGAWASPVKGVEPSPLWSPSDVVVSAWAAAAMSSNRLAQVAARGAVGRDMPILLSAVDVDDAASSAPRDAVAGHGAATTKR